VGKPAGGPRLCEGGTACQDPIKKVLDLKYKRIYKQLSMRLIMKKQAQKEMRQLLTRKPSNNIVTAFNLDIEAYNYVKWLAAESKTNKSYIVNSLIHEMHDSIENEKKKNKNFDEKNIIFSLNEAYYRTEKKNINPLKNKIPEGMAVVSGINVLSEKRK
jgi:hypothetical protein